MLRPPDNLKEEPLTSATTITGKSIRGNFLKLFGGKGATALLTLGSTLLTARALGKIDFGIVISIHSFLMLMKGFTKLSSFNAIIRYGVPEHEAGNTGRLGQLIRSTFVLDTAAALIGTLIAVLIVPLIGPHLHWDSQVTSMAMLYMLIMATGMTSSSNGVLRLFDRFDILVKADFVDRLLRLVGVALLWSLGFHSIGSFLVVYGLSSLAWNLYVLHSGWKEFRRHLPEESLLKGEIWQQHSKRFPGFWRLLNVVYWQSNLDLIPKQVAVLLVGFFLGPAMAGMYRLADSFAKSLAAPGVLLRKVLLGDLSRLWHRRDPAFASLLYRSMAACAGIGLVIAAIVWAYAVPLLTLAASDEYRGAAPALSWLMLAAGLNLGIAPLRAAAYAMDKAHTVLKIYALTMIVFVVAFPLLTPALGLAGAGMASAITSLVTMIAMSLLVKKQMHRLNESPPDSSENQVE